MSQKKISVIVVNLLPHPHTVQIGCSRVLILQSYGLGPVHGKDTHLWPLIHSFVENQYLKPERSLGRKIRQKQLNPWIFWPEELSSKSSVVVGNPDWVACNLSRRPVPYYHQVTDLPGGSGRGGGGGGWTLGFKEIYKYDSTTILTNAVGIKISSGPRVTEMMTTSNVYWKDIVLYCVSQMHNFDMPEWTPHWQVVLCMRIGTYQSCYRVTVYCSHQN